MSAALRACLQRFDEVFDHFGGVGRRHLQEGLEAVFGFAVGKVGERADDDAGTGELVAGLGDGGGFHFDGKGVGEVRPDAGNFVGVVDELVAADDQAAVYRGAIKGDRRAGGVFDQRRVAVVAGGHLRQLADDVVKGGGIGVVVRSLDADDDVALLHAALQSTSAAGVDDAGGLVFFQKDGGGDGGVYFADAALAENDGAAVQGACVECEGFADGAGFQAA